jgi:hypothetical protein
MWVRGMTRAGHSAAKVDCLPLRHNAGTSAVRKERALLDGSAMGKFDPLLPFEIGPTNGREARESGLRLNA